ncbi:unnamed protein product [Dracunculus medinensis]|uniref:MADF domain-containing protein n=1 Tax=Dracunculus medinensis TaxID=318479 RepID=A0A0N4UAR7_DRAME|nr:unnamed protein product [Dracunculus medinensis]
MDIGERILCFTDSSLLAEIRVGKSSSMRTECVQTTSTLNPPGEPSFNEILINTVKQYRVLYCNQRRAYENVDRNLIWAEIANKIGRRCTAEFAKKRWLQLRDRYRKEYKIAVANNFSQPQKWNHFHLLEWLNPYLQGALPTGSSTNSTNGTNVLVRNGTFVASDSNYFDYAAEIAAHAQNINECYGACDSDALEDIKPEIITLETILAVAEASANANEDYMCGGIKSSQTICSENGNINEEYNEKNEEPMNISNESSTISSKTLPISTKNALEGKIIKNLVKFYSKIQISLASDSSITMSICDVQSPELNVPETKDGVGEPIPTSKLRSTAYSTQLRLRSRNIKKYKSKYVQSSPLIQTFAVPSVRATIDTDWLNSEEMLFGRIVGLRLQKMRHAQRAMVRMKIMNLLDNEFEETAETGSSVIE